MGIVAQVLFHEFNKCFAWRFAAEMYDGWIKTPETGYPKKESMVQYVYVVSCPCGPL